LSAQLTGLAAAFAIASGMCLSDFEEVPDAVKMEVLKAALEDPENFQQKMQRAAELTVR
jgi:hypothetical protein